MANRPRTRGALLAPAAALLTLLSLLAPAAPAAEAAGSAGPAALVTDPTALVNPFIGTGSNSDYTAGNTFPGADVPHGMLQWSPDTTSRPSGGGYDYAGSAITGFSLTHVDGTGCAAAGDVPILPVTGALGSDPGSATESFSHGNETASPGYYSVSLGNGTSVALTTTTRAGIGQFTFPATTAATLLLKLDDPATPYAASTLSQVSGDELTGSVTSTGFCEATNNLTLYFAIEFSQPFTASGTYGSTPAGPGGHMRRSTPPPARRSRPGSASPIPQPPKPRPTWPPRSPGRPSPRCRRRRGPSGRPRWARSRSAAAQPRSRPASTPRCTTPSCFPA